MAPINKVNTKPPIKKITTKTLKKKVVTKAPAKKTAIFKYQQAKKATTKASIKKGIKLNSHEVAEYIPPSFNVTKMRIIVLENNTKKVNEEKALQAELKAQMPLKIPQPKAEPPKKRPAAEADKKKEKAKDGKPKRPKKLITAIEAITTLERLLGAQPRNKDFVWIDPNPLERLQKVAKPQAIRMADLVELEHKVEKAIAYRKDEIDELWRNPPGSPVWAGKDMSKSSAVISNAAKKDNPNDDPKPGPSRKSYGSEDKAKTLELTPKKIETTQTPEEDSNPIESKSTKGKIEPTQKPEEDSNPIESKSTKGKVRNPLRKKVWAWELDPATSLKFVDVPLSVYEEVPLLRPLFPDPQKQSKKMSRNQIVEKEANKVLTTKAIQNHYLFPVDLTQVPSDTFQLELQLTRKPASLIKTASMHAAFLKVQTVPPKISTEEIDLSNRPSDRSSFWSLSDHTEYEDSLMTLNSQDSIPPSPVQSLPGDDDIPIEYYIFPPVAETNHDRDALSAPQGSETALDPFSMDFRNMVAPVPQITSSSELEDEPAIEFPLQVEIDSGDEADYEDFESDDDDSQVIPEADSENLRMRFGLNLTESYVSIVADSENTNSTSSSVWAARLNKISESSFRHKDTTKLLTTVAERLRERTRSVFPKWQKLLTVYKARMENYRATITPIDSTDSSSSPVIPLADIPSPWPELEERENLAPRVLQRIRGLHRQIIQVWSESDLPPPGFKKKITTFIFPPITVSLHRPCNNLIARMNNFINPSGVVSEIFLNTVDSEPLTPPIDVWDSPLYMHGNIPVVPTPPSEEEPTSHHSLPIINKKYKLQPRHCSYEDILGRRTWNPPAVDLWRPEEWIEPSQISLTGLLNRDFYPRVLQFSSRRLSLPPSERNSTDEMITFRNSELNDDCFLPYVPNNSDASCTVEMQLKRSSLLGSWKYESVQSLKNYRPPAWSHEYYDEISIMRNLERLREPILSVTSRGTMISDAELIPLVNVTSFDSISPNSSCGSAGSQHIHVGSYFGQENPTLRTSEVLSESDLTTIDEESNLQPVTVDTMFFTEYVGHNPFNQLYKLSTGTRHRSCPSLEKNNNPRPECHRLCKTAVTSYENLKMILNKTTATNHESSSMLVSDETTENSTVCEESTQYVPSKDPDVIAFQEYLLGLTRPKANTSREAIDLFNNQKKFNEELSSSKTACSNIELFPQMSSKELGGPSHGTHLGSGSPKSLSEMEDLRNYIFDIESLPEELDFNPAWLDMPYPETLESHASSGLATPPPQASGPTVESNYKIQNEEHVPDTFMNMVRQIVLGHELTFEKPKPEPENKYEKMRKEKYPWASKYVRVPYTTIHDLHPRIPFYYQRPVLGADGLPNVRMGPSLTIRVNGLPVTLNSTYKDNQAIRHVNPTKKKKLNPGQKPTHTDYFDKGLEEALAMIRHAIKISTPVEQPRMKPRPKILQELRQRVKEILPLVTNMIGSQKMASVNRAVNLPRRTGLPAQTQNIGNNLVVFVVNGKPQIPTFTVSALHLNTYLYPPSTMTNKKTRKKVLRRCTICNPCTGNGIFPPQQNPRKFCVTVPFPGLSDFNIYFTYNKVTSKFSIHGYRKATEKSKKVNRVVEVYIPENMDVLDLTIYRTDVGTLILHDFREEEQFRILDEEEKKIMEMPVIDVIKTYGNDTFNALLDKYVNLVVAKNTF